MPNLKSIKRKIESVKNTSQITRAMKMVAAAKFKKNLSSMNAFKPFMEAYEAVVKNISANTVLYSHPYFKKNTSGDSGVLLISSDRGLCGSFNVNLFKLFLESFPEKAGREEVSLYISGKKALDLFKRHNFNIAFDVFRESAGTESANKDIWRMLAEKISGDFVSGKIKDFYIISNEYVSTISQRPRMEKILPFDSNESVNKNSGGYLVEPFDYEDEIIDKIFKNYLSTKIQFRLKESSAGEQASRMSAMDNATRNSEQLIRKLTVSYNKARQAAVTLEILDIINGVNSLR